MQIKEVNAVTMQPAHQKGLGLCAKVLLGITHTIIFFYSEDLMEGIRLRVLLTFRLSQNCP